MLTLSERAKKILFITFFVLFTVGTGYALYFFFFRPLAPTPQQPAPAATYPGALGQAGQRGPVIPSAAPGAAPLPSAGNVPTAAPTTTAAPSAVNLLLPGVTQAVSRASDGSTRFYNPDDSRFYHLNPDGSTTALSDRQFYNVQQVDWSSQGNNAILEFPDGSKIHYDFDTQRQDTLPAHWQDFQFSPNDNTVVAKSMGTDENNRFLMTADADGNGATALYHLGNNADLVIPSWSPTGQVIGFSKTGTPQPDNSEEILLLGPHHENYKPLIVAGHGFQPNWSPTGQQLLYSVYQDQNGNKPALWVSDASGNDIGRNRKRLNLETWADKCVWSDPTSLYCAVPVELPTGAGLDESTFASVPDDIYKVDLTTGMSVKISTPDQNLPVVNPILSADGKKLLFTHGVTGQLYSYTLSK